MIPPDRAKQEGYNPTHFAKAQPTPLEGYLQPPTYHPETRPSIAHKDLCHGTTQGGGAPTHTNDRKAFETEEVLWTALPKPVAKDRSFLFTISKLVHLFVPNE